MHFRSGVLAIAIALVCHCSTVMAASDEARLEWQFHEGNDQDNKGRLTAWLTYAIPETDGVRMVGVCDATSGTNAHFSSLTFVTDVGTLTEGTDVDLRFSGGGTEHTVKGRVQQRGEEKTGLTGVALSIPHTDPLWTLLSDKERLDVMVPGYGTSTLSFEKGRDSIAKFIGACRSYAERAGPKPTEVADAGANTGDEKAAFEAAKELGTADAWNAFLSNYPTGFHADLARAYVKNLAGQPQDTAPAEPQIHASTDEFPVAAGSWGGIVRQGPGQNYPRVDSLPEGKPVTLIGRTDTIEHGYPWFVITYDNGKMGYKWGGILCSTGAVHEGLAGTCTKLLPAKQQPAAKPKPTQPKKAAPKACPSGQIRLEGRCIPRNQATSFCGPGFRPQGGRCVRGPQPAPAPGSAGLSARQKEALRKGCQRLQVWSAQEGCHYDD